MRNPLKSIDLKKSPNKREKIFLLIGIFLVTIITVQIRLFPVLSDISSQHSQIEVLEKEKLMWGRMSIELTSKKSVLPTTVSTRRHVKRAAESVLQPLFLRNIEVVKSQFSEVFESDYSSMAMMLIVRGGAHDVLRYLKYIETLPASLVVEKISLTSTDSLSGQVTLDIKGTFYGS